VEYIPGLNSPSRLGTSISVSRVRVPGSRASAMGVTWPGNGCPGISATRTIAVTPGLTPTAASCGTKSWMRMMFWQILGTTGRMVRLLPSGDDHPRRGQYWSEGAETYDACDNHTSAARLGAADVDRRIGPRDQKRTRKAARTDNTRHARARTTTRSGTAHLRRANRSSAVRADDCRRGWRAERHRAPSQHRNNQEHGLHPRQ
jgi:hypothetical protein